MQFRQAVGLARHEPSSWLADPTSERRSTATDPLLPSGPSILIRALCGRKYTAPGLSLFVRLKMWRGRAGGTARSCRPLLPYSCRTPPPPFPFPAGSVAAPFRFLSIFKWEARKGWDVLLQAYLAEFTPDEDVELVIKV